MTGHGQREDRAGARTSAVTRAAKKLSGSSIGRAGAPKVIPEATVARLASYLRVLSALPADPGIVSSNVLAETAGVKPAGLRRDLSFLGSYGTRGVGYDVTILTNEIRRALGAARAHPVALVGVGNLGAALAGYAGFPGRGFVIAELFDSDPEKIGRSIAGLTVKDVVDITPVCRSTGIAIGIIATPASSAQSVADALVSAGVYSILDFAPGLLVVPDRVEIRKVDLALELQILAFHQTRLDAEVVPLLSS